jgi:hypothetical protein
VVDTAGAVVDVVADFDADDEQPEKSVKVTTGSVATAARAERFIAVKLRCRRARRGDAHWPPRRL